GTVSPTPDGNRVNFDQQICHPDIIRRANSGEKMTEYTLWTDSTWLGYVAVLDMKTLAVTTHLGHGAWRWAHEAWSGDGESLFMHGYAWRAGRDAPSVPIRIVDREEQWSNHYGTCGRSGRYVAGDSGRDGMERLELTDLWTGEVRTVAHVSTPTEPAGRIAQDHGHPAGSPDGTKVIIHSCYDLVNHRLYAVPTQDIRAGDAVIPVETTEGFAAKGKLLIGHGYAGPRTAVSYERTDATHFYGCDWGQDAPSRLKDALKSDAIPKGSRHITDFYGRLYPSGECRPRKEYIAVVKSPDPPRGLAVTRTGQGVRLTWQPPDSHEETAGYVVYGFSGNGPVQRLTPEPVTSCEFMHTARAGDGKFSYLVRAVERCGLYGSPSSVAWVDGAQTGVDLMESYDVRGSAYITPGERPTSDRRSVRVHISAAGDCVLWGRGRAGREAQTLRMAVDGQPLTDVQIEGADWHWVKLAQCRLNAGEHVIEVAAETTCDIRDGNLVTNPSFEDGLQGWTFDGGVTSLDSARSHSGKQSVKLSGHLTGKKLFQVVDLEVKPEWSYRLSFWVRGRFTKSEAQRYHGPHPNTLGRIAALVEPFPYPTGWAVDGNKFDDVEWREVGLMFSSPPQEPGKPTVKRVTVQPFWCPHYWGEQVGTVWIDDVSVTELGPRLRPVKLTKLLVT
ncbi:MAG: hypothetical protein FJ272_16285, partial [Planctomycetes bacterium]|nr:hypothetical protein [Planctomycetota bacterium]